MNVSDGILGFVYIEALRDATLRGTYGGDKNLSLDKIYGIYALLNSTLFDMYYRILNGSTQVNSTEINHIPVPPLSDIREIGKRLIQSRDLSTIVCDEILSEVSYG